MINTFISQKRALMVNIYACARDYGQLTSSIPVLKSNFKQV